jgi:hypothetical protein
VPFDHAALVAEHVGLDLGGVFDHHPGGGIAQLAASPAWPPLSA